MSLNGGKTGPLATRRRALLHIRLCLNVVQV